MDRDSFVKLAKAQLTEWNADLAELRARIELADDGTDRQEIQAQIDRFLAERRTAMALLDKIGSVNGATWTAMAAPVQKAWGALEARFKTLKAAAT